MPGVEDCIFEVRWWRSFIKSSQVQVDSLEQVNEGMMWLVLVQEAAH